MPPRSASPVGKFQPTRPRGARLRRHGPRSPQHGFNPRAHAGRDLRRKCAMTATTVFQPTRPRGARPPGTAGSEPLSRFQPTRPRGARLDCRSSLRLMSLFQPTRPRGARRSWQATSTPATWFQPTRPRGARHADGFGGDQVLEVSTHAPTRGATRTRRSHLDRRTRFNPRAHAGRDPRTARQILH